MAARAEAAREDQPHRTTPTRTSSTAEPSRRGTSEPTTEVSLTQFRAQYPGWVSVAQGG